MSNVDIKKQNIMEKYRSEMCCSLCNNAQDLIDQITEHLKTYHAESIHCDNIIQACSCDHILELKEFFINHQISHRLSRTKIGVFEEEEEDCIVEYVEEEMIEEDITQGFIENTVQEIVEPDTNIEYITIETKDLKRCRYCDAQYSSAKSLQSHYNNEHDPNNKIECSECNNRFNCERKYKSHLNKHEAERSYKNGHFVCQICNKICVNKGRLIAHRQTHFQDYECDYCGKKFTKSEFLKKHVIQHAFGKNRKDKNDITGKIICTICTRHVSKDRMKRHNFIFHSNERPYVCNIEGCGKSFKYSEPYSNHMDMHAQTPKYKCEFCSKSFYNQSNLRHHLFRHTDPDKFKCSQCNERFGSSSSLKLHVKRFHKNSSEEEEVFECTIENCRKSFKHIQSLQNHMNQVHRKQDILRKCDFCSHTCYNIKNMQKHISRIHHVKKRERRIFPINESE